MENRDRNKKNAPDAYDNSRERQVPRTDKEDHITPPEPGQDKLVDLDGDGLIGNTGGFYGGTSYLGSNYGEDWNAEGASSRHEGNYGAAGQQDTSSEPTNTDDNSSAIRHSDDNERNPGHLTKDDSIF
jgi:hypothetical protein